MQTSLPVLAAMLGFASPAFPRHQVLIVGPSGPYTQIQPALDAAHEADVVLVESGGYAGFTLAAKGVCVVADAGASVLITGPIAIRDLAPASTAALVGLDVQLGWDLGVPAVSVENALGAVRIDTCDLGGSDGNHEGDGVRVWNSTNVALVRCNVQAGNAYGSGSPNGLDALASNVAIYDCTFHGGKGGNNSSACMAYGGGNGVRALGQLVFASGSFFAGGAGGNANTGGFGCGCGADGGDGGWGFSMSRDGHAFHLDDVYVGGAGGSGACGSCGGCGGIAGLPGRGTAGTVHFVPAKTAKHAPALEPVRESQSITLALHGTPGDSVWLLRSPQATFRFSQAHAGVQLAGQLVSPFPLGSYDASGNLTVALPNPGLAPGDDARVEPWQTAEFDGTWTLGPGLTLVVLDDAF